jgi:hypothetical protein
MVLRNLLKYKSRIFSCLLLSSLVSIAPQASAFLHQICSLSKALSLRRSSEGFDTIDQLSFFFFVGDKPIRRYGSIAVEEMLLFSLIRSQKSVPEVGIAVHSPSSTHIFGACRGVDVADAAFE